MFRNNDFCNAEGRINSSGICYSFASNNQTCNAGALLVEKVAVNIFVDIVCDAD